MSVDKNLFIDAWPEWDIQRELGRGSYGIVYEAVNRSSGAELKAAIKMIRIPRDRSVIDQYRKKGMDDDAINEEIMEMVNKVITEMKVMEKLKDSPNIVSIEDFKVADNKDGFGKTIFIRMELLTPLNSYRASQKNKELSETEVISLGEDICGALEYCARNDVLHRDVKPDNIFRDRNGTFKLGDFGIARSLDSVDIELTNRAGTDSYMAPEVYKGNEYNTAADLYSLGLTLYMLLNNNRLPFLGNGRFASKSKAEAVQKRLNGELLPPPCNASPAVAEVILRACAPNPRDRFANASEMKAALYSASALKDRPSRSKYGAIGSAPVSSVTGAGTVTSNGQKTESSYSTNKSIDTFGVRKKDMDIPRTIGIVLSIVAAIAFICAFCIPLYLGGKGTNNTARTTETVVETNKNAGDKASGDAEAEITESSSRSQDTKKETTESKTSKADSAQTKSTNHEDLIRTYSGVGANSVTENYGDLGYSFELEILSCTDDGEIEAVETISSMSINRYGGEDMFGSYRLKGTIEEELSDGRVFLALTGTDWIDEGNKCTMKENYGVTISADRGSIKDTDGDYMGVDKQLLLSYDYSDIVKKYSGKYSTFRGFDYIDQPLDLTITSYDPVSNVVNAEFHALSMPNYRGSVDLTFLMSGKIIEIDDDGSVLVALVGTKWIDNPNNKYKMIDFYLRIDKNRKKATNSGYKMELKAE